MGRCKINPDWLKKSDTLGHKISTWAQKSNDTEIFCKICTTTINCDKKGFQALEQHVSTAKHKTNARTKLHVLQLHLMRDTPDESKNQPLASETATNNMTLYSSRHAAIKAEIMWGIKNVICNWSAASCHGIAEMFREMFTGVPLQFTLSPSKLGYMITDGLGPYFREMILEDCRSSWFSLIYDETTNSESQKELQVAVRYWSKSEDQVVVHHLESFFLGEAKAVNLVESIQRALDNANLPIKHLLMLGSDGPNVNKTVYRLMNECVKADRKKGLLDAGTCNIHIVHNAFLKGLQELGNNVSEIAIQIFYYFDGWPKRWADFMEIQEQCGLPHHRFIKHVPSRWLTLQGAALRLIEQWKGLCKYFLKELPKKKQPSAKYVKDIVTALKIPTLKAELHFVTDVAELHKGFTQKFQANEPLIHLMYDELKLLFLTIAGRIFQSNVVAKLLTADNPFSKENLAPIDQVACGDEVDDLLKNLSAADRLHFRKNAQNHYLATAKHLFEKTCLSVGTVIKHFRCFQPQEIKKETSIYSIKRIAEALPLEISVNKLVDEWKLLMLEKLPTNVSQRIDFFWCGIINLQNSFNEPKYPTIGLLVKASLSVSHGSADIERGFSCSGIILTPDKTRMSLRTLNARLHIKDGMKRYRNRPELIPITDKLILAAKFAHQKYKTHLEDQERLAKEEEIKKNKEQEIITKKRALEEEMEQSKKKLKVLEKNFKQADLEEMDQRKLADRMLAEANDRLKAAVAMKDMQEVQLAHSMLESVKHLRQEEDKKKAKKESIYTRLEDKRAYLLSQCEKSKAKSN